MFIFITLFGYNVMAQDTIVLKNGNNIRAIVEEIGINDVKYKKFDFLDGPFYILRQSDIKMIKYEDGQMDVFSNDAAFEQPAYTNRQTLRNQSRNQTNSTIDYATFNQLRRNDVAMENFLWENDAELFDQFYKGVKLRRAGKGLLGSGLGLSIGGLCLMISGSIIYENSDNYEDEDIGLAMTGFGAIGFCVGQALIITSIPLSAVGGGLKRRAANGYEEKYYGYKSGSKSSLDFTFTGNGVGLALRF